MTNKVLLCACARFENNYILEWVEYNLKAGFSNIVIYDNNDLGDDSLSIILKPYTDSGFVIIEDWRGKKAIQGNAYTECYTKYGDNYEWIAYFDCDEFIEFENKQEHITNFVNSAIYSNFNQIRICWKNYTDSNILTHNNNFSMKRFTDVLPKNHFRNLECKSIIRTKQKDISRITAHGCLTCEKSCNIHGMPCNYNNCNIGNTAIWDKCWINHYRTKTLQEFVEQKLNRGDASTNSKTFATSLDLFFEYNEITKEKLEYLKSIGLSYDKKSSVP